MPVCNYDGEVIGVAQIINKRGGGNNHEFTETDLKVLKFIFYVLIFLAPNFHHTSYHNSMVDLFYSRSFEDISHFVELEFRMHSFLKFLS